jgi:beta-glucosidase
MTTDELFRDPALSIESRAADLLSRMTLDEKIAQLGSCWTFQVLDHGSFDVARASQLMVHGIGQITRVAGATDKSPRAGAELANTIQHYLREQTRLGIPAIVHEECLHGFVGRDRTCYPQSIGLASTWDPELVEQMATRIGRELRASGAHQALAPILDVTREPRWGRLEETFGEDAYLVARLGTSYVRGIQGAGRGRGPDGILATAKHLVGHGLPEGGFNHAPAHIGSRELRDVFLLPFEAAVRETGLRSVMHAYDDVDGVPCVASHELLTTILREEWGFDGMVVSDYSGIDLLVLAHQVVGDMSAAGVMALEAGLDVELPSTKAFGKPLLDALARGAIEQAVVDQAVVRVLREKLSLGLFEQPFVDVSAAEISAETAAEDHRLARQLAQRSIVLLSNDGVLPLAAPKRIAVLGPTADSARNLMGDYAYVAHIESLIEIRTREHYAVLNVPDDLDASGLLAGRPTILDTLRGRAPAGCEVLHAEGVGIMDGTDEGIAEAVAIARGVDVAIVVVGERSGLIDDCQSGEARDRMDIGLPGRQAELVAAVAATGTPVVLVIVAGRPLAIPHETAVCAAVMHAWVPGDEGAAAITDILFGDVSPGGKLPITVPYDVGQIPVFYGHKPTGGHSSWKGVYVDGPNLPLWPFGFGMSYSTFEVSDLSVAEATLAAGDDVPISVSVRNTGTRAADEVVQLYVRDVAASVTRPVKQLAGFARVSLAPGERRTVTFRLAADQLAFTGVDGRLRLEPGRIDILVGRSSVDIDCQGSIDIVGGPVLLPRRERFFSSVDVA